MELKGKLFQVLDVVTGEGKNGTWSKQDFVIETDGEHPKKVCFTSWGDKINLDIPVGTPVSVFFDAESREYNGRWFTELKTWKATFEGNTPQVKPQSATAPPKEEGDLPF